MGTGDRCNDLYELSKHLQQFKWRSDKSNEDYEYEKSKDECTFVPNIIRISNGNDASDHVSLRALRDKKSSL